MNLLERDTYEVACVLFTLINLRMGWWMPNPRRVDRGENFVLRYLASAAYFYRELFGKAKDTDSHIFLSDGGHFETMGIYELLRRRCKYIFAIDGTLEPARPHQYHFDGVPTAIRRVRVDFGIHVDIDLCPLLRDPVTGFARSHYAVGLIRYPDNANQLSAADAGEENTGILILFKAGLLPD